MHFTIENRFESIDILRGVAALAVCLYHFSTSLPDFLSDTNILKGIGWYGYVGVEIFFIISGFIIPFSLYKGNYRLNKIFIFFSKRIIRIEPPYFISIALAILLKYLSTLAPLYQGPAFNIAEQNILYHIGYLCDIFNKDWINPVYWTLAIEFQFYILIALCYTHLIATKNKYAFYIGIVLLNIPLCLSSTSKPYLLHFMPYFTLGIIYFRTITDKMNRLEFYILAPVLLLIIYLAHGMPQFIAGIATILTIIFVRKSSAPWVFLGKISFSLYLLHTIIGARIINLAVNFTHNESGRVMAVLLAVFISIICSYVFYLLVEKPFMKLSHNITYDKV